MADWRWQPKSLNELRTSRGNDLFTLIIIYVRFDWGYLNLTSLWKFFPRWQSDYVGKNNSPPPRSLRVREKIYFHLRRPGNFIRHFHTVFYTVNQWFYDPQPVIIRTFTGPLDARLVWDDLDVEIHRKIMYSRSKVKGQMQKLINI